MTQNISPFYPAFYLLCCPLRCISVAFWNLCYSTNHHQTTGMKQIYELKQIEATDIICTIKLHKQSVTVIDCRGF